MFPACQAGADNAPHQTDGRYRHDTSGRSCFRVAAQLWSEGGGGGGGRLITAPGVLQENGENIQICPAGSFPHFSSVYRASGAVHDRQHVRDAGVRQNVLITLYIISP